MPAPAPAANRATYQKVWAGEDTYATTLLTLFVDTYGTDGISWDPETIILEIYDDFGVQISQGNLDKLMTAITLISSDAFYKSLPDFVAFCNVLNDDLYDPETWDPADAADVAWGITEAALLAPPDEDEPFTDEIRSYIAAVLDAEGIMQPPDILRLAIRDADQLVAVQNDFSDDVQMFEAIYKFEQDKTDAINRYVQDSLKSLSGQLTALPLRSGNASNAVQRLLGALA